MIVFFSLVIPLRIFYNKHKNTAAARYAATVFSVCLCTFEQPKKAGLVACLPACLPAKIIVAAVMVLSSPFCKIPFVKAAKKREPLFNPAHRLGFMHIIQNKLEVFNSFP
ncbi:MAG: hypothetical protein ACLVCS_07900 [Christensenellaceae bacterium]